MAGARSPLPPPRRLPPVRSGSTARRGSGRHRARYAPKAVGAPGRAKGSAHLGSRHRGVAVRLRHQEGRVGRLPVSPRAARTHPARGRAVPVLRSGRARTHIARPVRNDPARASPVRRYHDRRPATGLPKVPPRLPARPAPGPAAFPCRARTCPAGTGRRLPAGRGTPTFLPAGAHRRGRRLPHLVRAGPCHRRRAAHRVGNRPARPGRRARAHQDANRVRAAPTAAGRNSHRARNHRAPNHPRPRKTRLPNRKRARNRPPNRP